MAWSFAEKTVFGAGDPHTGAGGVAFSAAQKASIIAAMQAAYDGSGTARTMFENWVAKGGVFKINQITASDFYAYPDTGEAYLNLGFLTNATYIDTTGTVVKDTLFTALIHELGHALTGKPDGTDGTRALNYSKPDYKGDNVIFVNQIYKDLGIPEQVSYIAYDSAGTLHKPLGYKYTNGATIDDAVTIKTGAKYSPTGEFNSTNAANTRDLLIGDSNNNKLQTGGGDDFLVGGGKDDYLNGGAGKDTAVYFDLNPADYDVRRSADGKTWTVKHVRGDGKDASKSEGSDTLENIESIQFGAQHYDLKKNGLTFQTDFAFVIDTTGSMGTSIGAVKAKANDIINSLFADGKVDARVGIVGFKDTTIGERSSIILNFADQDKLDDFSARKSAAINAINGISVGGGGDEPETDDDGLLHALNGDMGDWRVGAGVHRIVLFTDAPVKDVGLRAQVEALAKNIGATITKSSSIAGTGGAVDTFELGVAGSSAGDGRSDPTDPGGSSPASPALTNEPGAGDTGGTTLQIFTIFTGPAGTDTSGLADIANRTGGSSFTSTSGDDLVNKLLEIIKLPPPSTNIRQDFNGDGHSDFLWQNNNGTPATWLVNGLSPIGGATLSNPGAAWHEKDAGDFNGDGKADILWQNNDGTPAVWLMNGVSAFSGATLFNPGAAWHTIASEDFNGDGKADILWQNNDGTPAVWLMDGLTPFSGATLVNPGPAWHVIDGGDFNGDGKADILWQNNDGTPAIWLMNGLAPFNGATLFNPGPTWHAVAAGDFNGDGKSDILWQNNDGTPAVWLVDGLTPFSGATLFNPGAAWHVIDASDFNGDGKADILWQNNDGTPAVWLMNGTAAFSGATFLNPGADWHLIG